ncbi:hypothetical protein MBLNU230_g7374t2 [Neophaeotheca triangularis]
MHTLFSSNILSPAPAQSPQQNPFELVFASALSSSSTASDSSQQSSVSQHGFLTQYMQSQQNIEGGQPFDEESTPLAKEQRRPVRRKGSPRLLLLGQKRSGKSSIQNVVFQKLPPAETLYLDSTHKMETSTMSSFLTFEATEIPSHISITGKEFDQSVLNNYGAAIWVLDVQDEYFSAIGSLIETAIFVFEKCPRLDFSVFIHKIDGLSDEYKTETFRDVRQRVQDELSDAGYGDRGVSFYQTSIFDHTVFEASSKVIQRLLPQLPALEGMLNRLCSTCRIQKCYLFDTMSKIYVATDASPTFLKDYEVCSDYVDIIADIKEIYGWKKEDASQRGSSPASQEDQAAGESVVTYDRSGDTYVYAKEVNE